MVLELLFQKLEMRQRCSFFEYMVKYISDIRPIKLCWVSAVEKSTVIEYNRHLLVATSLVAILLAALVGDYR